MFLFSNIFETIATLDYWLMSLIDLYSYILIASVIISWINADPYNPIVNFIYKITDPLLSRIRRFVPAVGGIDFSPMVALFALLVVKKVVLKTIYEYLMHYSNQIALKGMF